MGNRCTDRSALRPARRRDLSGRVIPGITITTDERARVVRDVADPPGIPGDPEHLAYARPALATARSGQATVA